MGTATVAVGGVVSANSAEAETEGGNTTAVGAVSAVVGTEGVDRIAMAAAAAHVMVVAVGHMAIGVEKDTAVVAPEVVVEVEEGHYNEFEWGVLLPLRYPLLT